MIAYRCQYESTNLRAIQLIRDGKLGTIQAIESANGFVEKAGEWRLNRKLAGGGPLMDMGVYSLNACRFLTGEEPAQIEASCSVIDKDGRFAEVEDNVGWTMRFPSGHCGKLHHQLRREYAGVCAGAWVKGSAEPGTSLLLPRHQPKGGHPWRNACRGNKSRQGPSAICKRSGSFRRLHSQRQTAQDQRRGRPRDMQHMANIYKACGRTL
jgi:predicted dehydrogenase